MRNIGVIISLFILAGCAGLTVQWQASYQMPTVVQVPNVVLPTVTQAKP